MPIFHGSSYYHIERGRTGDTGPTGPTGPQGIMGFDIGSTGPTGPSIAGITIDANQRLLTTFINADGTTIGVTTNVEIVGPPNNEVKLFVFGENVSGVAGATLFKESADTNSLTLRVLGSSGDISLHTNEEGIEILYDRGTFGYVNVTGGGETGNIVGVDSSGIITGIPRTKYNPSEENTRTPLSLVNKNFAEYFSYKERTTENPTNEEGYYASLISNSIDGLTAINVELFPSELENHYNVYFDIHNLNNSSAWGISNSTEHAACIFDIPSPPEEIRNQTNTFMLVTRGVSGSSVVGFSDNVKFPFEKEPCFSGKVDITNFLSKNEIWYGVPVYRDGVFDEDSLFSCKTRSNFINISGNTGACCQGADNCTHVEQELCDGYFYGPGTTCGYTGNSGKTGNICYGRGACCIRKVGSQEEFICYDNIAANECINFNLLDDYVAVYNGDGIKCKDTNCKFTENEWGYCCDGLGNCANGTIETCVDNGFFFGEVGVSCRRNYYKPFVWDKNKSQTPCSSGTGGCCIDEICYDNYSYSNCMKDGGLFAGAGSSCEHISCPVVEGNLSGEECSFLVDGTPLQPGDLYAGGMVVGMFKPGQSLCFGATAFGGRNTDYNSLLNGSNGVSGGLYVNKHDYHGYGFSLNQSEYSQETITNPDSYLIILSMEPIAITGDREIATYPYAAGVTTEFYWNNSGSSWGPLYNQYGEYDDISLDYHKKFLQYKEGFWYNYNQGHFSLDSVVSNTFTSKKKAHANGDYPYEKLLTRPLQNANGMWHRNWGLYNSIRMISADNILYEGYTGEHSYSSSDFGPGLTSDYISAIRATRLLDDGLTSDTQGLTGNPENISGWYIPSYDELSFLAAHCLLDDSNPHGFNLNIELMKNDGIPLGGYHWSSTGSFDERDINILTNVLPELPHEGLFTDEDNMVAGSVAWSMNFDLNGIPNNFITKKKKRTEETCKIRPIRLIRCDNRYYGATGDGSKVWNLPPLVRDKDKEINQ